MNSIRKWLYRPKKSDNSLLAQFYFVDEDLNLVASELDSFDGRKDPERCTMLVNQLRVCQDKVLQVIQKIMDDAIKNHRANRDFRVKFPDDVLQDSLSGQLWFGAECLAAGSSILNREVESASMRPLARALTKNLDSLRNVLREQCLKSVTEYTDRIREALIIFDKLFAEFELSYVSAMVPVKTMKEYDMLQEVTVLFSETVQRALLEGLLTQDMLDDYDPALMFTIPRLAIVCGLLVYPEGPLNPDLDPTNMTEMFRPFQTLLFKIRELLYTLNPDELCTLEKALCSNEEPEVSKTPLAGQGLESLQIDQGFDEGGEGIVNLDILGSDLLIQSTSSGSPVTPVNTESEFSLLDSVSTPSTIIDTGFRFSSPSGLNLMDSGDSFAGLNKSESQDSGLHSENISTSDSVTVDVSPSATNQDLDSTSSTTEVQSSNRNVNSKKSPDSSRKTGSSKPIESIEEDICDSEVTDSKAVCDKQDSRGEESCEELSLHLNEHLQSHEDVWHFCQTLVHDIIEQALKQHRGANDCDNDSVSGQNVRNITNTATDISNSEVQNDLQMDLEDDGSRAAVGLTRQFSWQYNMQLASQNYSLLEVGAAGRSSDGGSISSESTLSDQGTQDSVTDFVVETLSAMTQNKSVSNSVISESSSSNAHVEKENDNVSNSKYKGISNRTKQILIKKSSISTETDNLPSNSIIPSRSAETSKYISKNQLTNKTLKQKCKVKKDRRESLEHINCKTGPQASTSSEPLDLPVIKALKDEDASSYSSCQSTSSEFDCDKDSSCAESETSSCTSENNDEEEIALAIEAAELASRNEARSRFRSSSDLIHRLFVCIAGVADQLQTNYASDLRHILKCVFELNSTNMDEPEITAEPTVTPTEQDNTVTDSVITDRTVSDSNGGSNGTDLQVQGSNVRPNNQQQGQGSTSQQTTNQNSNRPQPSSRRIFDEPPEWEPDNLVERCTSCKTPFTFVRRRHHCRNCGKIFCGKCSSTTVPLPQYGHQKPVRVCHNCFIYQIAHFTMQ